MSQTKYISVSEFAKINGVSKHTLYHYDDIQLFCPILKPNNKYRYYSIDQIETFQTITILKDLGMSLNEIKNFLDQRNQKNVYTLLDEREKDIDHQILHLKKIKAFIQNNKNFILKYMYKDFEKITIESFEKRYYLMAKIDPSNEKEWAMITNQLIVRAKEIDFLIAYIQYKNDIEQNIFDHYTNVVLLLPHKIKNKGLKVLPKGNYVVAYHKGDFNNIGITYKKMMSYIEDHHLEIEDEFIEYYVIDNLLTQNPEEYITEINVKIKD